VGSSVELFAIRKAPYYGSFAENYPGYFEENGALLEKKRLFCGTCRSRMRIRALGSICLIWFSSVSFLAVYSLV